jgi:large subunit ribosomal protein L28
MKCDICGKGPQFGHKVSHSKHATNRRWLPNIHPATITLDGKVVRAKICSRCRRLQVKIAGLV